MMARLVPNCPNCGKKLPYDNNARTNKDGSVESLNRYRSCPCGYFRREEQVITIHEYFPESSVCEEPKHPSEGGYGYAK